MGLAQTLRSALHPGPGLVQWKPFGRGFGEGIAGADVWSEVVAEVVFDVSGIAVGILRLRRKHSQS